jgi:tetratricopeptide (TPR) repeat protein
MLLYIETPKKLFKVFFPNHLLQLYILHTHTLLLNLFGLWVQCSFFFSILIAIFQKDKARRIRERAEEAAKLKKEEHDKWWRGAELHKEYMADRLNQKVTVEIEGEIFPKQQVNKGKDCLDYSVWDKWVPDDPVSLAEMKEKVDKVDAEKNVLFEKNNPDFCNNFKEDMEKREKTKVRKETDAERNRQKGNKKFKKKEYKGALKLYKEALQLTPLVIPILTNIAQAYIKLNDYDEATEYCNRALFLDEQNVKALSRRSLCFKKKNDYINALKDLETAQTIEPGNASILKELKLCKMEKAEKEAEDEVLKLVQPTLLTTAVDSESKQLKKDAADTSSDEQVKDKENSKEISVSEKAAQFLEMAVTTSNKNTNDQHNTVSDTTPPMAPAASTKTFTKSNSISEMAANSPDKNNIPFEFKLMDDAFEMYNKWWRVEGGSTSKDAAENAKLAAGSLVPLLLTNDAMRIYFRRCGFSKTLHETLIEFTTSTMDISISTTETGINQDSNTERKNERPIASSSMLVTILTVISAACRNRLVQEEFVVEFNGLNHVANVLSTAIIVDNTARATVNGGSKETQPARSKLTDISLIRACVDVIEACTTHESSIKMILNHVRNESKKKKKKKKKITLDAVDLACQIPILLLEVMHTVESNTHILRHAVDALCTLTANVQADEIVPYMSLLSTNGLNIIHVLSNILIRTTGKDSSTHPAVESCRESCSRCMTALSIHSQWRAYFCAFNAIPSLISVLKPNTVDTVAARANALAALMNGACASGDMASEVYTEIRDQIHKGGAVAWLVHLMEPKEIFTKVDVQSMNKKKEGKGNQQDVTFESNYSRVTTANQRAALVLQKRSRKSLDDHVRERSAGLLVSFTRFCVDFFLEFMLFSALHEKHILIKFVFSFIFTVKMCVPSSSEINSIAPIIVCPVT